MRCFHPRAGFPCGRCPACLLNRQRQFAFRLEQEKQASSYLHWLTLQYDPQHVPKTKNGELCVSKEDCRTFFERMRKAFPQLKFKHFLVSEYGPQTYRPHYHCILFVKSQNADVRFLLDMKKQTSDYIRKAWNFGYVCEKHYHNNVYFYVTKYCCKPELIGFTPEVKPFTLVSRGIGEEFLAKLDVQKLIETENFRVSFRGSAMELPRYYKQKLLPSSNWSPIKSDLPNEEREVREKNHYFWQHYNDKQVSLQVAQKYVEIDHFSELHKGERDYHQYEDSKINQQELQFNNNLKRRQNL